MSGYLFWPQVEILFLLMYTWLNHGHVIETIGIEFVSTTKGNGDHKQEEIQQINTYTELDISQRNRLIRIWIALYFSTYFIMNIECAVTARRKAYPL